MAWADFMGLTSTLLVTAFALTTLTIAIVVENDVKKQKLRGATQR